MNREEFIKELNERIKTYPDHNDVVSYYFELISDKMESGMSEEEAVASLGDIDSIVKNIEETNDIKANPNDVAEFVEKTENKTNSTPKNDNKDRELSGGRKFAYVLWCIASVIFCVASVVVTVASVAALIGGIALIGVGVATAVEAIAVGLFFVGAGIFVIGFSITAIHYSNVLRRYVFSNREKWNADVKKKAMGE